LDLVSSHRTEIALVGLITLVGMVLRLPSFGDSLFGDELSAVFIGWPGLARRPSESPRSHSSWSRSWRERPRFPSRTFSAGDSSVLAPGLLAAALVALSPFLIYYSSEGRPYALLVLLVLLATLSLLRALRTMRWTWWLAYSVFACAAAYTHFTSVFPLAGIFLWAFLSQPQARRQIVLATAGAVVGFLPWLPTLIKTTRSPGTKLYETLEPFSLDAIRFDLGHWAIGHPYQTLAEIPESWAVLLGVLGVVLALAGVAHRWAFSGRRQLWHRPSAEHVLVAVLALAAPVGAALYSELRESVWGARNVIAAWPGFASRARCTGQLPAASLADPGHIADRGRLRRGCRGNVPPALPPA
jgi:hypothetical protein